VRHGTTLVEMLLVLCLIGILATMALPAFSRLLDGIAVQGAAAEVHALFGTARHLAIHRGEMVTVDVDTAADRLLVHAGADTLRVRALGEVHRVKLSASRSATTYAANGIGYGASNMTILITRGGAEETLTVSRLGRVRR
jgi:prepilin-type N-terminal cleavage/methylation domain-containing protein